MACAGPGGCHGCLRWCNVCGDLARVSCDDPECDIHKRRWELQETVGEAQRQIQILEAWIAMKQREVKEEIDFVKRTLLDPAEDELRAFKALGDHMCLRGSREALVRAVMES